MPDGCNLYRTKKDLKQISGSISQKQINIVSESVRVAFKSNEIGLAGKVLDPLTQPKHPAHKAFSSSLVRNVTGKETINANYKEELPKAVAAIAKVDSKVLRLVLPIKNWKNTGKSFSKIHEIKTSPLRFPYVLLGTASLIENGSISKHCKNNLRITSSDRIDLGIPTKPNGSGAEGESYSRPKHGNLEADLIIRKPDNKVIGANFLHSMDLETLPENKNNKEIDVITNELREGEIKEFHFVTNGEFSEKFREIIKETNDELLSKNKDSGLILIHENVKYGKI